MTDPTNNPEDMLKKPGRRNWLRNAAIIATGGVVLPSFLTGCTKEQWDMVKGQTPGVLGSAPLPPTPLTTEQLMAAEANLHAMRDFVSYLYSHSIEYETLAFLLLTPGETPANWKTFISTIFTDLAVAMFKAAALPSAAPALALTADFVKKWSEGNNRPSNLNGTFEHYLEGHQATQRAIEEQLSFLADPINGYGNLKAAWTGDIVFKGTAYKLADLATAEFPRYGADFFKMNDAAFTTYKQGLWNLIIMKCCGLLGTAGEFIQKSHLGYETLVVYAQKKFYSNPKYAGSYLRGQEFINSSSGEPIRSYATWWWDLGIGGNPFPPEVVKELFIDDTPDHTINSNGLFKRSYVFQQFNIHKPNFAHPSESVLNTPFHELATMQEVLQFNDSFDESKDDFTFTGGMFPQLTQP